MFEISVFWEEMNTFHRDGYQRGMWSMNIQVLSPLGATWWNKNVWLVLTETGRALWVMFGQEPISPNSVCKKIKVVEKADKRCRQAARSDKLIPRVITHWRAAKWGQPGAGQGAAGCQSPPSCTHAESSGHVILQWLKKKKKEKTCNENWMLA